MVRNNQEHYFSRRPASKLKERKIQTFLRKKELIFYTGSSVFSPKKIDLGSKLLIEKSQVKESDAVLDLGCGYGAVGITIAKTFPKTKVIMSDVNERAVMFAKKNIKENKVKAKAIKSDCFDKIQEKFDVILLNPPQTAGKKLCFKMIEEAKKHLNKEGSLQLVARHQKGGKSLQKKMEEVFGNVKAIAKKSGYRIYFSQSS